MFRLFFRKRGKDKKLSASKVMIIGVGNGGANVVDYMQVHGFEQAALCVCDMDASVVKHSIVDLPN